MARGLFIGLTTVDFIYLAEAPPQANQKVVAIESLISAGGPATNAAVAFAALGGAATLLSSVGQHPITSLIHADLESCGVRLMDLTPEQTASPPVSSIVITQATGDRSVISLNAQRTQVPADSLPQEPLQALLADTDVVLIDGHQMALSAAIAQEAKRLGIPVVIDGGSWKPGFDTVLPFVEYAICSANFQPPGCATQADVFAYLRQFGIQTIAITQGAGPIVWCDLAHPTLQARQPPSIVPVDTLGAGDIFHGAFCHAILQQNLINSLDFAGKTAAFACRFLGTRSWSLELP
ncbi:PfkB family carbohydrate kinase [Alkalinema sp. FACHB-956]|uniref:PfkB family carbohydrate kinase n=1 Tax=Alkalinema sp. FACHB-956 TaxID=2692768 RepID=UPI0016877501|nr:PfkB family carbohydrate kinase [Alkalinema sp. FACHB-956]MBD2325515.1 sugar kinase [Alkalinema sp. FACHB-956]